MSTTITAILLQLLTIGLPFVGVNAGNAQLTTTVQTIVLVASGIWIWYKRVQVGDVTAAGIRKN